MLKTSKESAIIVNHMHIFLLMAFFSFQGKDHTFRGHGDSVDQLCWHPSNPELLVTASGDKTVRMWDARSSKSVTTINTKGEGLH